MPELEITEGDNGNGESEPTISPMQEEIDKMVASAIKKSMAEAKEEQEKADLDGMINDAVERAIAGLNKGAGIKPAVEVAGESNVDPRKVSILNQLKAFGFDNPEEAYEKYYKGGE